jgi:hypothetical protein
MISLLLSLALADCSKTVEVQLMYKQVSPIIFFQPKKEWREGKKKEVIISCELYKKIEVGDMLEDAEGSGLEGTRFSEGSEDGGLLEYRYYKVLKK